MRAETHTGEMQAMAHNGSWTLDAINERLAMPLAKETELVEVLIDEFAMAPNAEGIFDEFHQAAIRDERVSHVATAYRRALRKTRLQHLPRPAQSCVYASAARFFADVAEDTALAMRYAEQAIEAQPANPLAREVLEVLYVDAEDAARLSKLYHRVIDVHEHPEDQLRLARRAVTLMRAIPASDAAAASLRQWIVKLDASDLEAFDELQDHLARSGNYRELAALLERRLEQGEDPEDAVRWRLMALYRDQLDRADELARHLEVLLQREPVPPLALQGAEAMLESPSGYLVAPAVAELYRRVGRSSDELSVLTRAIRTASGDALDRMEWRLAHLRVDLLDDPAGALDLVHPLLQRAPGRDDVRRFFIDLSRRVDQLEEAARKLDKAARAARDPDARARAEWDVAQLALELHNAKAERDAYKRIVQSGSISELTLRAAEALLASPDGLDRKSLERALAIVAERGERYAREGAAERLLELKPGPGRVSRRAAWIALMDTEREQEALAALEELLDPAADAPLLATVFERRAASSIDEEESYDYGFRAADLRAQSAAEPAGAVEAWRQLILTHGASRAVYARMLPLLEEGGDYPAVADTLHADSELAPPEERADILSRLGDVLYRNLKDTGTAIEAYRRALVADPGHLPSRARLQVLLTNEDAQIRLHAAEALEPALTPDEEVWLQIHELRAEALPDPVQRLDAFRRAAELLRRSGSQPSKGRLLCVRALRFAVLEAPEQVADWIELLDLFAASSSEVSEGLAAALDDGLQSLVGEPLVALATATGLALAREGRTQEALRAWLRAVDERPTASLMRRIDGLLTQQGATLDERVGRYREVIVGAYPADRADLALDLAQLLENANDRRGAAEVCGELLREESGNPQLLRRLVFLLKALGETQEVKLVLERALPDLVGEDRAYVLGELAGCEPQRAAELYAEALRAGRLGPAMLSIIKEFAADAGDFELQQLLLEHRAEHAGDPLRTGQAFEELGRFLGQQFDADAKAASAFKRAAGAYQRLPDQREHAIELLEHALTLVPEDLEAAEPLMFLFVQQGQWSRVAESLTILLRSETAHGKVLDRVVSLFDSVVASGSVSEFVSLLEEILWLPELAESPKQRDIMATKARALAVLDGQGAAAADAFRSVIEAHADPRDLADFAAFVATLRDGARRLEESRWLFEWKLARGAPPVALLSEWALAEEDGGDVAAALGIYERLAEHKDGRITALEAIQRLRVTMGDWEAGFEAMAQLLELVPSERKRDLARQMATVAVRQLLDPLRALPYLEMLLPEPEAVELLLEALAEPVAAKQAAALFDIVIESLEGSPQELTQLLQRLLDNAPSDESVKPYLRKWFAESLAAMPQHAPTFYEVAVAAARQFPLEIAFWEKAEGAARLTNDPEPTAKAYQDALLDPEVAVGDLGRRAQAFFQEWYGGNSAQSQALLELVCDVDPTVRWAFDRLKLALTSRGEWQKLFVLYDRALRQARDEDERASLLDEASVAAKDFASEPERALAYLEPLRLLRPHDPRVESALERLYERLALWQPLAALLEQRLPALDGRARRETELRLADLWLAMEQPEQSLGFAGPLLDDDTYSEAAAALLERIAFGENEPDQSAAARLVVGRTLDMLESYYRRHQRFSDVARVMQRGADEIGDVRQRIRRLRDLVQLELEQLDDPQAAFNVMCALVVLDPASEVHRFDLGELAKRTYSFARWASALCQAAAATESPVLALELFSEAATVYLDTLDDREQATRILTDVMLSDADRSRAFAAAQRVAELERGLERWPEYCAALERAAVLSFGQVQSARAWNDAARAVIDMLGDADRAITDWRRSLALDDANFEAQCGLVEALTRAGRREELVQALLRRASVVDPASARGDRAGAASLLTELGRVDEAIVVWSDLGNALGHDAVSLDALSNLLVQTGRLEELAALWRSHAESAEDVETGCQLWVRLGQLLAESLGSPHEAIEAYVRGGAWSRACTVAVENPEARDGDPLPEFTRQVLAAWSEAGAGSSHELTGVVLRAVRAQARRALEAGDPREAAELLRRGAELPFSRDFRRELIAEAAATLDASGSGREEAIQLLAGLVREDPVDGVSKSVTSRLVEWLEEAGRFEEVATTWELVARGSPERSERGRRAWYSAGTLWEEMLGDDLRAANAFRFGAEHGSLESLRALARVLQRLGELEEAAEVQEALLARVEADERESVVLGLVEVHVALGAPASAVRHIERVRASGVDSPALRGRLLELYQASGEYAKLAELLAEDARHHDTPQEQAVRLADSAEVHLTRLEQPERAVPLLTEAARLDPEDGELPLRLAVALSRAGEFERAVNAFESKLASYGERRPQERGIVHRFLSRALLAAGQQQRAYQELEEAADIYPDHPGIQHELAELALKRGELDRAERTCRTLLLMLRSAAPQPDAEMPTAAAVYLDLSEIATQRGDTKSAEEFIHSAFEASMEGVAEGLALEKELERRGMGEWQRRALESRVRRSSGVEAAEALAALAKTLQSEAEEPEFAAQVREAAEDLYAALVTAENPDARAVRALASVFEGIGSESDLERAGKMHRHLVILRPLDPRAWRSLVAWLEVRGRLLEVAELALELRMGELPPARPIALELARVLTSEDATLEPALHLLRGLLAQNCDDSEALELLVASLENAGRSRELVENLEGQLTAALDLQDVGAAAGLALRLAGVLERSNRLPEAVEVLRGIIQRDPENSVALRELRRLLAGQGAADAEYAEIVGRLAEHASGADAAELGLEAAALWHGLGEEARVSEAIERGFAACPAHTGILEALLEREKAEANPERTRDYIERSLTADPSRAALWARLVRLDLDAGLHAEALHDVELALEYHASDPLLRELRVYCLEASGRLLEAVDAAKFWRAAERPLGGVAAGEPTPLLGFMERAIQLLEPPRADEVELELAAMLVASGLADEALDRMSRWAGEPATVQRLSGYRYLVDLARNQGQPGLAADVLELLVGLVSDDGERLDLSLAWATECSRAGREHAVRSALEMALSVAGGYSEKRALVVERLDALYRRLGAWRPLAQLLIGEAAEAREPRARFDRLLSAARVYLDDAEDAVAAAGVLERALEVIPEDLEAMTLLARVQAVLGERERATAMLHRVLRRDGAAAGVVVEGYRLLAELYLEGDELHDAYDALRIAHELEKQHVPTAMRLGLVALDLDDLGSAEAALRFVALTRSREDDGVGPEERAIACYHLAHIVRWTGKPVQARMYASKGLSEHPEGDIKRKLERFVSELRA